MIEWVSGGVVIGGVPVLNLSASVMTDIVHTTKALPVLAWGHEISA